MLFHKIEKERLNINTIIIPLKGVMKNWRMLGITGPFTSIKSHGIKYMIIAIRNGRLIIP